MKTKGEIVLQWFKWILIFLIVLVLGVFALYTKFNLGGLLDKLFGSRRKNYVPKVLDAEGKSAGEAIPIVENTSPLRDKSKLELGNGIVLELPKGVQDADVEKVFIIDTDTYDVQLRHGKLTDIFGRANG